jgi:hypothetical protein
LLLLLRLERHHFDGRFYMAAGHHREEESTRPSEPAQG